MDAFRRSWDYPAPFGQPASFNGHHIINMEYNEEKTSPEQVFLMALSHAIGDCAKRGTSDKIHNKIDALEVLKHIGQGLKDAEHGYAYWLEAKVRRFAREHPLPALEFEPKDLCAIFLPSAFVTESANDFTLLPISLQGTSGYAFRSAQPRLGQQAESSSQRNAPTQGLGFDRPAGPPNPSIRGRDDTYSPMTPMIRQDSLPGPSSQIQSRRNRSDPCKPYSTHTTQDTLSSSPQSSQSTLLGDSFTTKEQSSEQRPSQELQVYQQGNASVHGHRSLQPQHNRQGNAFMHRDTPSRAIHKDNQQGHAFGNYPTSRQPMRMMYQQSSNFERRLVPLQSQRSFNHQGNNTIVHGPTSFQPSRELVGRDHAPSHERLIQAWQAGMQVNPQYRGDLTDLDIANASCPPDQNCAVRIENISAQATCAEIFSLIYEGKIFSFSIKDPIPGRFQNCAARLVFTTRQAAVAFVTRGRRWEGIVLHGYRFLVKWNRDACRPVREGERHQSRIIQVTGPEHDFNVEWLERLFHTQIAFQAVETREWLIPGDQKVVQISFNSILGQSRIAYKFFYQYMDDFQLRDRFSVTWGLDPCERRAAYPAIMG